MAGWCRRLGPWLLAAIPAVSAGADHPIGLAKLLLVDGAAARARLVARRQPGLVVQALPDPTAAGATLEIVGRGAGDGGTGTLVLPAERWTGLGSPPGRRGYRFLDPARATGVRKIVLRGSAHGGTLKLAARDPAWPYRVAQAQEGPIDVRLTVGGDVVCARVDSFLRNRPGRVRAKDVPAPDGCPASTCGNGLLDGLEECDDGNASGGDGCSAACQLESASGLCAGVPTSPGTALGTVLVASGLASPVHLTAPPLDPRRLFVVEQAGRIRVIRDGALLPAAFLDLSGRVSCCGERGLLSLAFHSDYESNRRFFVNYTDLAGDTVIARYETDPTDPDRALAASRTVLLTVDQDFANHNGGQLAFGPDGFLYVGMGDGGSAGDPNERAQDPATLLGKLLRLDVDRAGPPWAAAGNPFHDDGASDPLDEIWALGLRNPWRFSFDRMSGDLYVADVGQNRWEEVNVQPATSTGGENYGWDVFEGDGHCFEGDPGCATPGDFVMPVLEYAHAGGACSVTGGFVYRGCALPDLRGTYFYGDYCAAFIRTFEWTGSGIANAQDRTADLTPGGGRSIDAISSFGEDARGELYVLDIGGEVFRIGPGS